jgi:hypothetical protein
VAVTNNSGLAGIAYWIHTNIGEKAFEIRKDHVGLIKIKDWIDEQYAQGRITSISDEEMRLQLRNAIPELFE